MQIIAHTKLKIKGRVQGVFYRQSAYKQACQLNLGGWVKNVNDGSVLIEVYGESEKVKEFIAWCHIGPPNAKVESVTIEWQKSSQEVIDNPLRFEIVQ